MQETLRIYPVTIMGSKRAVEDEVIPLSEPLILSDGRSITEIPVSEGQKIWVNIPGYNRLPGIFGENAHEFNIDRWFESRLSAPSESAGIYSSLMSFSHGPRSCIGEYPRLGFLCAMCSSSRRVEV